MLSTSSTVSVTSLFTEEDLNLIRRAVMPSNHPTENPHLISLLPLKNTKEQITDDEQTSESRSTIDCGCRSHHSPSQHSSSAELILHQPNTKELLVNNENDSLNMAICTEKKNILTNNNNKFDGILHTELEKINDFTQIDSVLKTEQTICNKLTSPKHIIKETTHPGELSSFARRVSAVVRVRPPSSDVSLKDIGLRVTSPTSLEIFVPNENKVGHVERSLEYHVDRVLGLNATQEETWDAVSPSLESVMRLNGSSVTVMAYGATGTGKTYTMLGPDIETMDSLYTHHSVSYPLSPKCKKIQDKLFQDSETKGILPRLCDRLFDRLEKRPDWETIEISVSNFEIYREKIIDLLLDAPTHTMNDNYLQSPIHSSKLSTGSIVSVQPRLTASTIGRHSFTSGNAVPPAHVTGLRWIHVESANDLTALLLFGARKRSAKQTQFNDRSSRSHSIWQIKIEKKKEESYHIVGEIHLIDLAGAEKSDSSLNYRDPIHSKEMASINKSLSSLSQCIQHLAKRPESRRPFRDSKLTRLLSNKFKGHGHLVMIFTASPYIRHYRASILTLQLSRAVLSSPYYSLPIAPPSPFVISRHQTTNPGVLEHRGVNNHIDLRQIRLIGTKQHSRYVSHDKQNIYSSQQKTRNNIPQLPNSCLSKLTHAPHSFLLKPHDKSFIQLKHYKYNQDIQDILDDSGNHQITTRKNFSSHQLNQIVSELWLENQNLKKQLEGVNSTASNRKLSTIETVTNQGNAMCTQSLLHSLSIQSFKDNDVHSQDKQTQSIVEQCHQSSYHTVLQNKINTLDGLSHHIKDNTVVVNETHRSNQRRRLALERHISRLRSVRANHCNKQHHNDHTKINDDLKDKDSIKKLCDVKEHKQTPTATQQHQSSTKHYEQIDHHNNDKFIRYQNSVNESSITEQSSSNNEIAYNQPLSSNDDSIQLHTNKNSYTSGVVMSNDSEGYHQINHQSRVPSSIPNDNLEYNHHLSNQVVKNHTNHCTHLYTQQSNDTTTINPFVSVSQQQPMIQQGLINSTRHHKNTMYSNTSVSTLSTKPLVCVQQVPVRLNSYHRQQSNTNTPPVVAYVQVLSCSPRPSPPTTTNNDVSPLILMPQIIQKPYNLIENPFYINRHTLAAPCSADIIRPKYQCHQHFVPQRQTLQELIATCSYR